MPMITGTIASGRGSAARHVSNSLDELASITGKQFYPGTLNVVLDKRVRFNTQNAMPFDKDRRFIWPAMICDYPVWLYRWKGAPLHIVEVLSECKLRDTLGLEDNGRIYISIDMGIVDGLRVRDRVSSLLLWGGGRRGLYYNSRYAASKLVSLARKYTKDGQR